jgi:RecB family exonuclease
LDATIREHKQDGATMNVDSIWTQAWNAEVEEIKRFQEPNFDIANLRQSVRRTKAVPDGENAEWWFENGKKFLNSWIQWRANCGWEIWETPQGVPAIELMLEIETGGVNIKGAIDRVFVTPQNEIIIVDLKTGMRTPQSDLQLQVYACMLERATGVRPHYGAYWMARQGGTSVPTELNKFTLQKLDEMISLFQIARENNLYLPNFESCKMCSVMEYCYWVDGEKSNKLGEINGNK